MTQRQKGNFVGEMLKDMGLLDSAQRLRVLSVQNAEFLSQVKRNEALSPEEKVKIFEYLDPKNSDERSYEDALNAAKVRPEVKRNIRVKRYGEIATDLGFVSKDQKERVNALQASDRMNFLAEEGLGKALAVEKGQTSGNVDAQTRASKAKSYLDDITSDPVRKEFVSDDPLTRQAQAAGALSKALYSAIEIGGEDVATQKSVKDAQESVKRLADLYKLEAAQQYRAEGATKTADTLSEELKGVSFPENAVEEKKSLMQKLWDGVKNAFKAIKKGVEHVVSWVKNGFRASDDAMGGEEPNQVPELSGEQLLDQKQQNTQALIKGTDDALKALVSKHNLAPNASISPDSYSKGKDWLNKQAGRTDPSSSIQR